VNQEALVSVLVGLGDDELVLGHRHSEWTGYAPHIEADIAFSSIAQDEIGHAAAYYSLACELTDDSPDHLALGREPDQYRNALLVERENHDWAYTLARHWIYDHADALRLETLEETSYDKLGSLVRKIRREERYHLLHADTWMKRLARGPVEGRSKVVDAIGEVFAESAGLFEPFENEQRAVYESIVPVGSVELRDMFTQRITKALDDLGMPSHQIGHANESAEFVASSSGDLIARDEVEGEEQAGADGALGGRKGHHSPDFKSLWDVMTSTYRSNPGATW
jgi:ring-1,2-phenylacetyl-CoA epoxidase subunit PaaC